MKICFAYDVHVVKMFDDPGGPILGAHRTLLYAPLGSFFQKPNEKGLPMKGSNFQIIYQKQTQ